jgi:S1-C subfamily serine protease
MDIISKTIIDAVNKVKNSVVKINRFNKNSKPEGAASGFVFSSDGYIFTNHHVIANSSKNLITMLNGEEYEATCIGSDADTDVAILKCYDSGYSVAKLGNSNDLEIGQLLIAIGNPLGFQHSVSVGVLSGKGRTMRSPSGRLIENVLQTDIALNPGNSGGPLINTDGEVVGINTAIIPFAQGISFSIDLETAKEIAKYLIKEGKITKAYLGVMLQDALINPRIRNFYKLSNAQGAMIIGMKSPSPALRAHLREGDIIIGFDSESIINSNQIFKLLTPDKIFQPVKLKILRQTKMFDIDIFPVERPAA